MGIFFLLNLTCAPLRVILRNLAVKISANLMYDICYSSQFLLDILKYKVVVSVVLSYMLGKSK